MTIFFVEDGAKLDADNRRKYIMNSSIPGLEESDLIILVGTNPRMEAPLINTKIRKCVLNYGTEVCLLCLFFFDAKKNNMPKPH